MAAGTFEAIPDLSLLVPLMHILPLMSPLLVLPPLGPLEHGCTHMGKHDIYPLT